MENVFSIEDDRNKIIETINKVIEEIKSLKAELSSMKAETEQIKNIGIMLKQIELAINPKQKRFKDKIDSLDEALEELTQIRFNIMLSMTDIMFEIIKKNLIDGMELRDIDVNFKEIVSNKEKVGNIKVLEENMPEIKIRVTVYESSDEFDVYDPYRMYSIISFINTKFNYKESNI